MSLPDPVNVQYRDKIDTAFIFNRLLLETVLTADEAAFPAKVRSLHALLPLSSFNHVEALKDVWAEEEDKFFYKMRGGRNLGREDDPLMHDREVPVLRLEDDSIDWEDENIRSPKRELVEIVDSNEYLRTILTEAESIGILWNVDVAAEVVSVKATNPKKTPSRSPQ